MLRDLGQPGALRTAECDPNDSVFAVLLWFDKDDRQHFEVGSIFLSLGEAKAAAERYAREGSVVLGHEFDYATVQEYQTGQLAPKGERHGSPYPRESVAPQTEDDEKRLLLLEINRLRAQLGTQQLTTP